jgi:Phage integrase, N-terminal SAM-like domain
MTLQDGSRKSFYAATRQEVVKPRPWRRASDIVRLHITPVLGGTPLNKLTPQQVQALYARKLKEMVIFHDGASHP